MRDYNEDDFRFLEQILNWVKKNLELTPSENRRRLINTSRYWRLRTRLPFLYRCFLSDLWIWPFRRVHGFSIIWNVGDTLIQGGAGELALYLTREG